MRQNQVVKPPSIKIPTGIQIYKINLVYSAISSDEVEVSLVF